LYRGRHITQDVAVLAAAEDRAEDDSVVSDDNFR
jgi:hypothetical protein